MTKNRWIHIAFLLAGAVLQGVAMFEFEIMAQMKSGLMVIAFALAAIGRADLALSKAVEKAGPTAMVLLLAIGMSGCLKSCGQVVDTVVESKIVKCGATAVSDHQIALLGPVNDCLTGATLGLTGCLLGLVDPVVGITKSVVICMVRDRGSDFAAMAQANTEDTVSSDAADNARTFLTEQGVEFED